MGKLAPWKVWGRYEKNEETADHQIAHVEFGSIEFVYKRPTGDVAVERKFLVQEVTDTGHVVVVKASEATPGAQPWEFNFRQEPKLGSGIFHWVLHSTGTNSEIEKTLPMTEKYWVLRFGMWSVLGFNAVFWLGLLSLLYYWYYYG